ncbi:MAG TPA: hypothetical protein VGL63_07285 [Streptosporangiaceae bacterium]|jgi:hypothetical protein
MSSDRGTIPRGTGAGAGGAWSEPTAPAGRRLPSAPRERKPALAALAVVLVVGGALIAALLVIDAGHKTGAIEISQTVGQGQQIPFSSMREVQVTSGTGINYVPWSEASQVAQTYAAIVIPEGTLFTKQMSTSANNLAKGRTVIGLALKDGQLPDNLQVGNHIDVFDTSDNDGRCPRPADNVLSTNAVILDISRPASGSSDAVDDVQVAVNPADASSVSCNAANNNVGVGIMPSNGEAASSAGTSPSPGDTSPSSGGTSPSSGGTSPSSGGTSPSSGGTTPSSGGTG